MTVKLLIEHQLEFLSLKEGCIGSSESIPVKMPHCWKSRVTAPVCEGLSIGKVMDILQGLMILPRPR